MGEEHSIFLSRAATMALVELTQALYKWPRLAHWRAGLTEYFERVNCACWTRGALVRVFVHGMVEPYEPAGSVMHTCRAGVTRLVECMWDEARLVQLRHCWEHGDGVGNHDFSNQSHPFYN